MASRADRAGGGHAQAMDAQYGWQRHVYDLTRKYYLLGRDRLIRGLKVAPGQSVLEVGVGTGRNLALAARLYPGARLFGLDISAEMLKSAARRLAGGRAMLARADACAFDPQALFGEAGFDRVYLSYCLSMIPDWEEALRQALGVVEPGGSLHVVDFGGQAGLPRWFRALLRGWLARFHVTPREALFDVAARLAETVGGRAECRSIHRDYAREVVIHL